MRSAVLLLVAVAVAAAAASPGTGPHVAVLKCCPFGETLDPHTANAPGGPACMRTDNDASSTRWAPKIFSKRQRTFLTGPGVPAHWTVHAASRPACGDRAQMVLAHPHDQPIYVLFEEGSLYLHETNELLAPGRFCVDSTAALVCPNKEDEPAAAPAVPNAIDESSPIKKKPKKARVRKCCLDDAVYSEAEVGCVARPAGGGADIWTLAGENLRETYTVTVGFPGCGKPGYAVRGLLGVKPDAVSAASSLQSARLEADGSVWIGGQAPLQSEDYCLEKIVELGAVAVLACPGEDATPAEDGADLRFTLFPALLFLSVFFLAATLFASCLLPAAYHQLHWRCQTNYVASLMLGELFLAITQVTGAALRGPLCVVFAILMHFLFLAAFFWLNTMCFNIWWTFRDLRPASVDKNQEAVRMRLYEVYAWGGPLIIAAVAAALDHLPADEYPHLLRPGFGTVKCWFRGDMELLPYFFGPLGVLLFINLCLFIATARELTCGLWKADGAKPTTERATLRRVCLKLVVVMGVTWAADVVSWAAGGPAALWYATDVVNALQGVLIFAVVGCQPHVWAAVKRLWCLRESRSEASRRALHLSSTSQGPNSLGPDSFTTTTTNNGTPSKGANGTNGTAGLGYLGNSPAAAQGHGQGQSVGVLGAPNSETPC